MTYHFKTGLSKMGHLWREGKDPVLDLVELAGGQDADVAIFPAAQAKLLVLACSKKD
jgi:hypothetical protein